MSDGSDSLQWCEEISGTESAEPPSSYGLRRPQLSEHESERARKA
jgi:hypothetical protein